MVTPVPQSIEDLALCLQNTLSPDRTIGKAGIVCIAYNKGHPQNQSVDTTCWQFVIRGFNDADRESDVYLR